MQSLYNSGLEHLYDDMYQTFIDYEDEFDFYSNIIRSHSKKSVLEIGCGTGHLAKHFISSDINYVGMDLSKDMVNLSLKRNPTGLFIEGNAINFQLEEQIDSAIITGRTTSYLLSNKDITSALSSIHTNLNTDGVLCFDFIDASRFLKEIKGGKSINHEAKIHGKHYVRKSFMKENLELDNHMFDWDSTYFEVTNNTHIEIARDNSTVRAFTRNEWELFLYLNNFKLIEFIDRKSYAFDTYVVVAKKID